jgi:hypothetical protein
MSMQNNKSTQQVTLHNCSLFIFALQDSANVGLYKNTSPVRERIVWLEATTKLNQAAT